MSEREVDQEEVMRRCDELIVDILDVSSKHLRKTHTDNTDMVLEEVIAQNIVFRAIDKILKLHGAPHFEESIEAASKDLMEKLLELNSNNKTRFGIC